MENKSIFSNFIWRFAERFGTQIVNLIVSIILARILAPTDYGIVALIMVFIAILNVFVDSGLGSALIQKKDADDIDFSTVFYFNAVVCFLLYVIIFILAPFIAKIYAVSDLTIYIRVLSIIIIISGIKNVQQAYISRTMQFKRFFYASVIGTLCAAGIGIVMAYHGFGVWSLIVLQIVDVFVDTCVLWITVKWRPIFSFSLRRLKELFAFGWKMLVAALFDTLYTKISQLIIGKKYTIKDLAYYNEGEKFPNLFVSNINASIDSVLFPAMSDVQDDKESIKQLTRRAIKISSFIMWPLLIGLVVTAEPLVRIFLTEKWIPCVPFLRIFCISYAFWPIHTANLNAIKALGRSDLFLKLECIKKIIAFTVLIIVMPYGVKVIAYSMLAVNIISQFVNSWPNKKLLQYAYFQQMKDILPTILFSLFAGSIAYTITWVRLGDLLTIILQFLIVIFIYIIFSEIFHIESWRYLKILLINLKKGKG